MKLSNIGQMAQKYDPDRFVCALLAPPEQREKLFALLAFNYEIAKTRESVSEVALGLIRLQWWREALDELNAGKPRGHEVLHALLLLLKSKSIDLIDLQTMVDTREKDLIAEPFSNTDSLLSYLEATSGMLASCTAKILGVREENLLQSAKQVGVNWGIIGVLRATPFLATQRRCFLPADLMQQNSLSYHQLYDRLQYLDLSTIAVEILENLTSVPMRKSLPKSFRAQHKLIEICKNRILQAKYNLFSPLVQNPVQFKLLRVLFT